MSKTLAIFEDRINHYKGLYTALNRKYNLIAAIRVIVFVSFLIAFVAFANFKLGLYMGITALIFPFIFGLVVKAHKKIGYDRKQVELLKKINEKEARIARGELKSEDTGSEYLDKTHPYINDLDIFGNNSIFQLLNRTTTKGGRDLLAQWLSFNTSAEEIQSRHEAVKELSEKLEWRQELEAKGLHYKMQESNSPELIEWIKTPQNISTVYKISAYIFPLIILSSIGLNIFTAWPVFVTLILMLGSGFALYKFQAYMKILSEAVIKHISVLGAYEQLIAQLESASFTSQKLRTLKMHISHEGKSASTVIKELFGILDFLNSRSNMFYAIINVFFLFDLHVLMMAENWKSKNKADVSEWFDAVSELEALCSIAGFSYAHPDFVFPAFSEKDYYLQTDGLGHPLISENERVNNNYLLSGKGSTTIITGSNMSGKSTFLRTLGVNITLAQAGAPVCAKFMELSPIQLFTSMRTQDNLEEHVSSFYAELQRIQSLLQLVDKEKPVLYMLDEILKGTNSQDRHIGAVALAKQLAKTNSFGLISTHDLALGELANSMPSVDNYSFNSEIKGDEIIFPYTLEKGVCRSFNASKLMEKIGIQIESKK